jgi:hypothetical protein
MFSGAGAGVTPGTGPGVTPGTGPGVTPGTGAAVDTGAVVVAARVGLGVGGGVGTVGVGARVHCSAGQVLDAQTDQGKEEIIAKGLKKEANTVHD